MELAQEILINQYAQGIVPVETLLDNYRIFDMVEKEMYLKYLVFLIVQSKCTDSDILPAIENSRLKKTYTPCVLLEKGGTKYHSLKKITSLPDYELDKVLVLFLNLFKIGYDRRFRQEKNNPNKWWYWDLSDTEMQLKVIQMQK